MKSIINRALALALCCLLLALPALAETAPEGVLCVINGVSYPVDDIQVEFDYYAAMYESYGLGDEIDALKDDIIEFYVQRYAQLDAAAQLGFDQFTEEEEADILAQAQDEYESTLEEYKTMFEEEGASDEDVRAAVVNYFEENDYTIDVIAQSVRENMIMQRYYDHVTADVTVDIDAIYEGRVAEQKAEYDADPMNFEYDAMYGGDIYYVPEGFRAVYHILLLLGDDDADALYELQTRQSEIAAELENPTETTDAEALNAELGQIDETIAALIAPLLEKADVVLDCMLGTGFEGELRAPFDIWIDCLNSSGARVVAVDVPSGLSAQTGAVPSLCVVAALTVTMLALQPGQVGCERLMTLLDALDGCHRHGHQLQQALSAAVVLGNKVLNPAVIIVEKALLALQS